MATVALRVHLIGGDRLDVTYEGPDHADEGRVIDHIASTLSQDSGVLQVQDGDRLIVLYGRGVAAFEVGPPGELR